ncbi:MAG: TonB family protein [Leptolyngbyaceae cyanobacterium SM2_5_2]|nr:TonB family protein [Leptolyngbyaceae cyanobacterium SM2_5_2]
MTKRFAPPKPPSKPLWQSLLAPMLFASLGLHAVLLMLPTGASDEAAIPTPDPEQDSVAITRVPPPSTPAAPVTQPVSGVPATQALQRPGQPLPPAQGGGQLGAPPPAQTQARRPPAPAQQSRPASNSTAAATPSPAPARPNPSAGTRPAAVPTPPPPSQPSRPLFNPEIGERLMAYAAALNLPQAQVDGLRASVQNRFGFAADKTTREAYSANLGAWEGSIRQETGLTDLSAEVDRTDLSVTYPQRVCLANEPGEVRVGVLVNPDGSQRGEPAVLRSSGYGALDQKALAAVEAHEFPKAEGIKAYTVTVATRVDYGRRPCLNPQPEAAES